MLRHSIINASEKSLASDEMEDERLLNSYSDKELCIRHFENVKDIFKAVLDLKVHSGDDAVAKIVERQKEASLLFVMLKKNNRLEKYRIRNGRLKLQRERVRIDSKRLQLQNLLYEVNHVKREIQRCYQFTSKDEGIELVSEKEFYAKAPKSITQFNVCKDPEHSKHLARLEWELKQRKDLYALNKRLTVSKLIVAKEIRKKLQRMNSYKPCIDSLLKAAKPLQLVLGMAVDQRWKTNRYIKLLPRPLYLAYMSVYAYTESVDHNVTTTIVGNDEDIRLYFSQRRNQLSVGFTMESASQVSPGSVVNDKCLKRKDDAEVPCYKRMLKSHPLFVRISLGSGSNRRKAIIISLHYFAHLSFVTAACEINLARMSTKSDGIISKENIMNYLFENDTGDRCPGSKALFQLKKIGMSEQECIKYISGNGLGKPYKWAQRICGLELSSNNNNNNDGSDNDGGDASNVDFLNVKSSLEDIIPEVLNRIKRSWNSRLTLLKQIHAIESKNFDACFDPRLVHSCSLVLWTPVSWDDICANVATGRFIDTGVLKAENIFYRAVIVRGSSKLECFISISNKLPLSPPLWILNLSWNGQHNALNNAAVKDMEYWTNSTGVDDNTMSTSASDIATSAAVARGGILTQQLARTMCSFDILLETEGQFYSPVEFPKNKHFVKPFCKRMRARPYRWIESKSNLIFKQ